MAILADQDKNKKKGTAPDAPETGTKKGQVNSDITTQTKPKKDKNASRT
jgi:hypothetical protein